VEPNDDLSQLDPFIDAFGEKIIDKSSQFLQRIFNDPALSIKTRFYNADRFNSGSNQHGFITNGSHQDYRLFAYRDKEGFSQAHIIEFYISKIPVTVSSYINTFFEAVSEFIQVYFRAAKRITAVPNILGLYPKESDFNSRFDKLFPDILTTNIEKIILINYLHKNFNNDKGGGRISYSVELLNRIWTFAHEVSGSKVENKFIDCGFIFQQEGDVELNSIRSVKIATPFSFDDFGKIKNYLRVSNGRDIFFSVTNGLVTHIILTIYQIKEVSLHTSRNNKLFQSRPLIVSIQSPGRMLFLEGGTERNKILFQIKNTKPVMRDDNFLKQRLSALLEPYCARKAAVKNTFIEWVLSLSIKGSGTSLFIGDFDHSISREAIKSMDIDFAVTRPGGSFKKNLSLLNNFILPDGSLIFNRKLSPVVIGAIVPNEKGRGHNEGGSRHHAIQHFTLKHPDCIGIVVSEDGPVTVYINGVQQLKF
jgi:DisA bacterial checkpoint controller nucleotide-binding